MAIFLQEKGQQVARQATYEINFISCYPFSLYLNLINLRFKAKRGLEGGSNFNELFKHALSIFVERDVPFSWVYSYSIVYKS